VSYRIPKDCSSIRKALAEKVILFQFRNNCAPQRNVDPELFGTGPQKGWGVRARAAILWGKKSVGTQQRWGKHEKKWRTTHSGRDEGGRAANRVRRLLPLITG
jgi:hypothetical protein